MSKYLHLLLLLALLPFSGVSQQLAPLTVDKIMRDPRWIGTSPSDVYWSADNRRVYFQWNPDGALSDSLYYVETDNPVPRKATAEERSLAAARRAGARNAAGTMLVYTLHHRLLVEDLRTGDTRTLLNTSEPLIAPRFGFHDSRVVFQREDNLYSRDLKTGELVQLTDFRTGSPDSGDHGPSPEEAFLQADALHNSSVLRERAEKDSARARQDRAAETAGGFARTIYLGSRHLSGVSLSPDGRFLVYRLATRPPRRTTLVPDYVTSSGYTRGIRGRPTAGTPDPAFRSYIYDRQRDTVYPVKTGDVHGIREVPAYLKDYPRRDSAARSHPQARKLCVRDPVWNPKTGACFVEIRSLDHKDRWLEMLDPATGDLRLLDRQHDSAWIGGPDIGWMDAGVDGVTLAYFDVPTQVNGDRGPGYVGWVDDHTIWYQSEKSGYSHLYTLDTETGRSRDLTPGNYEVLQAELSADHRSFFIITNRTSPGDRQFYQLDLATGRQTEITSPGGGNEVAVSFDGKTLALLHSTSVDPWELYLQENRPGSEAKKITDRAESPEYRSYRWRRPRIITFRDRAGLEVHASVYRPTAPAASRPGVIFVHGAGYLQDVDNWWSYYFREHMFMNMLCDQGYTVMDIDYRGSAGYGRDWRTAIYRHMGGNDLDDIVDGARYMAESLGVDSARIGIWGGSYGGFMTLMAMFKTKVFRCGAALRSVTDFAHYNRPYTTAILNTPAADSLAYVRSSPIYFAGGLTGHLLMCHGIVDTNVHFQDIIRLTQKLIELGKHGWQLAVYPVESHDFKEASSWTDEYTRVYELFETYLK